MLKMYKHFFSGILLILLVVLALGSSDKDNSSSNQQALTDDSKTTDVEPCIPGISAVDVYGNFKKKGFILNRSHGKNLQFWACEKTNSSHQLRIDITGKSYSKIIYVSGMVMNFSEKKTTSLARPFLSYVASIPYSGAKPLVAKEWVEKNINQIGATTTIGNVVFTILGNDKSRILQIKHKDSK